MLGNVVNKKTYWQCSFESLLIYSQVNALNLKPIPQLSAVSDLNKYDLKGNLKKNHVHVMTPCVFAAQVQTCRRGNNKHAHVAV